MLPKIVIGLSLTSSGVLAQTTAVSSAVFNNFVRFTNFAGAAYSEDCPTPPSSATIVQFFNDTATDTQATLYKDATAKQLILAFRGTSTPVDFDTDLAFQQVALSLSGTSCSSCKVHQGFQVAYATIASAVSSTVSSQLSSNSGYSLIVTGHSLGGGLASLASAALAASGKSVTTYTFGEPRNGNAAFTSYINGLVPNYYRVTHYNDGVPQIPPVGLGYQHHGTEYWEKSASGNSASTTFICSGTEPSGCNAAQNFGNSPINGAHIQYTNVVVAAPLFNQACGYV